MKINLHIQFDDGTAKNVKCNAADLVAFEREYDVSVAKLGDDPRVGWLLYLAWHSEKRTGSTKESYEKWLEKVETVGESDEDPKSKG
tara:strand:- start:564 stop:824 length:261 start_codon:yes stop_codon:yes gene_type:complete